MSAQNRVFVYWAITVVATTVFLVTDTVWDNLVVCGLFGYFFDRTARWIREAKE